jgi:hypothetical protein
MWAVAMAKQLALSFLESKEEVEVDHSTKSH